MKKNRPHSWHSTLQKGLNRARSRSRGREEREHRKEEKEQQAQTFSSNNKGRTHFMGILNSEIQLEFPMYAII